MGVEHVRVSCLLGRAQVIGLQDPHEPSITMAQSELQRFGAESATVYQSLSEAVADERVDAFIIATPNFSHLAVLQEIIAADKPVLLEKPMATTPGDAGAIVRLVQKHNIKLQVGLQYRYKTIYQESIFEALERNSVGPIHMITLSESRPPFLDKVGQWNKFSEYSGGTLVEKCCHYFDLMNLLAGAKPTRVFANGGRAVNFVDFEYNKRKSDIADHAMVIVDYENGVRGGFTLNMFSPGFTEQLVIFGERGRISATEEFDHPDQATLSSQINVSLGEHGASRVIRPKYPDFIEQSGHSGASYFAHQQFIDGLQGKQNSAADASDGFWSIMVGCAAERSIRDGMPILIADLLAEHQCEDIA